MRKNYFAILFLSILAVSAVKAQNPADCVGATPICLEGYVEEDSPVGTIGNDTMEVNSANSCFGNSATGFVEINPSWYTFTVGNFTAAGVPIVGGEMCVAITPIVGSDDYDFGIYNLTNADCEDIFNDPTLEVACNFSGATGCGGLTGALIPADGPLPACDGQMDDCLQVLPGETYAILVTNYSGSVNGYNIDFTGNVLAGEPGETPVEEPLDFIDSQPPFLASVSAEAESAVDIECGSQDIILNISENVLCATILPELITITNGPIEIGVTSVTAKDCELGGVHDNQFAIELESPLDPGGYFINITSDVADPTVIDLCGNPIETDAAALQIGFFVLPPAFVGNLSASATEICLGQSTTLSLNGSILTSAYTWYSPDGVAPGNELGTGNSIPDFSDFSAPGSYSFYVTEEKPGGCITAPEEIVIEVIAPPVPDFDFEVDCSTGLVSFTNTSVNPNPTLGPLSYFWNFGDQFMTGTTNPDALFTYQEAGDYNVTLSAAQGTGCTAGDLVKTVTIPVFPVAAFDAPTSDCVPNSISVTATGTGTDHSWDFGDGSAAVTGATVTHEYTTAGDYSITLTSSLAHPDCIDPLTNSTTQDVTAFAIPEIESIDFSSETEDPQVQTDIDFSAEIVNDMTVDYAWTFGEGGASPSENPTYSYSDVGTYDFCLTVTSPANCVSDPLCNPITTGSDAWLRVPTAFSPNNDRINDELEIEGNGVVELDFRVYNRWGEEVWRSVTWGETWDGTVGGKPAEVDLYLYSVEYTLLGQGNFPDEGTISLLR
ncbi:PKD domain-containing protein [Chitinophagales bacterium]|nr:PKD domain-containing protein [Chitinophagales bacterium]